VPPKSTIVIDATGTRYIDFDVLELIKEFKNIKAPEKHIKCALIGFKEKYNIDNTHNVVSEQPDFGRHSKEVSTQQEIFVTN
jgi:carbonic anhydrase